MIDALGLSGSDIKESQRDSFSGYALLPMAAISIVNYCTEWPLVGRFLPVCFFRPIAAVPVSESPMALSGANGKRWWQADIALRPPLEHPAAYWRMTGREVARCGRQHWRGHFFWQFQLSAPMLKHAAWLPLIGSPPPYSSSSRQT